MHVHETTQQALHPEGHTAQVASHLWPVMVTLVAMAFAVIVTLALGLTPSL